MSIYATIQHVYIPKLPLAERFPEDFLEICIQAVPAHIDAELEFLPPPVSEGAGLYRAVVICGPHTRKGTLRSPQEYENALLVLTGEEYARMSWEEMWRRIYDALEPAFIEARRAHNKITREMLLERNQRQREKVSVG